MQHDRSKTGKQVGISGANESAATRFELRYKINIEFHKPDIYNIFVNLETTIDRVEQPIPFTTISVGQENTQIKVMTNSQLKCYEFGDDCRQSRATNSL